MALKVMWLKQVKCEQTGRTLVAPVDQDDLPIFQHCSGGLQAVTEDFFKKELRLLLRLHGFECARSPGIDVLPSYSTVRDGDGEWHIECRFPNGEKYAAITVCGTKEKLADFINDAINCVSEREHHEREETLKAERDALRDALVDIRYIAGVQMDYRNNDDAIQAVFIKAREALKKVTQ